MNPEAKPLAILQASLDRPRELRFSLRALKRYSTATGKDVCALKGEAFTTHRDFLMLVWAMARETDPSVTVAQIEPHLSTSLAMQIGKSLRAELRDESQAVPASQYSN